MFAEKGFLDLLRLQENRELLRIENSKTGLKLYASIEHYRRLAKDDPELIEQIAREQGMIGKDEIILKPQNPPE
jgi:cell division protein FtsB